MDIILAGAGGCMRELLWQIIDSGINVLGYCAPSQITDEGIMKGLKYLGNDDFLINSENEYNVALCFGDGNMRKRVYQNLKGNPKLSFPTLVLDGAKLSDTTRIGKGSIICRDVMITVDGIIGEFTFVNVGATICHDARIGDFVTVSPKANIAGNVEINDDAYIGMGANIIQGITIGKGAVVGAGATVVKDVSFNTTVVGVPAKEIKK